MFVTICIPKSKLLALDYRPETWSIKYEESPDYVMLLKNICDPLIYFITIQQKYLDI
jgi:hypothetical protein